MRTTPNIGFCDSCCITFGWAISKAIQYFPTISYFSFESWSNPKVLYFGWNTLHPDTFQNSEQIWTFHINLDRWVVDVEKPTYESRNGVFRWFLMNLTFGLKEFEHVVFEIELEKAPQNPQNRLKYIKFSLFLMQNAIESHFMERKIKVWASQKKNIITNAECKSQFDLEMFGEKALGAPF